MTKMIVAVINLMRLKQPEDRFSPLPKEFMQTFISSRWCYLRFELDTIQINILVFRKVLFLQISY